MRRALALALHTSACGRAWENKWPLIRGCQWSLDTGLAVYVHQGIVAATCRKTSRDHNNNNIIIMISALL